MLCQAVLSRAAEAGDAPCPPWVWFAVKMPLDGEKDGAERGEPSLIPAWNRETRENLQKSPFSPCFTIQRWAIAASEAICSNLFPAGEEHLRAWARAQGWLPRGFARPRWGIWAGTGMERPLGRSAALLSFLAAETSFACAIQSHFPYFKGGHRVYFIVINEHSLTFLPAHLFSRKKILGLSCLSLC